ncbi:hypothetical protein HY522_00725 [bacterium]|nr:hypothetical protein [bacterium]
MTAAHFEFLSDWRTIGLALLVLASLLALAAGFVYPGRFKTGLTALRLAVLICFFLAIASFTVVMTRPSGESDVLYVLMDRSVSMDRKEEGSQPEKSRADRALEALDGLAEFFRKESRDVHPIYFAAAASESPRQVGDRRMTQYAPALALLLEKISAGPSRKARAVMISDGAASDEPGIDPHLSALVTRGVSVSVYPVGARPEDWDEESQPGNQPPRLFFRVPPPATATVGESIPLDLGYISSAASSLTVFDGSAVLLQRKIPGRGGPPDLPSSLSISSPGLKTIRVEAKNSAGKSELRFRIKILPRLAFELRGRPSWDARLFLTSAGSRPQISVRGGWGAEKASPKSDPSPEHPVLYVLFDPGQDLAVPERAPAVYWPQMEPARMDRQTRGIRWLGRQTGSFLPAFLSEDPRASSRMQPLTARQKISLDLGWKVLERYTDGEVFLAERDDTQAPPAFLVNGEGLWRWRLNPQLMNAPYSRVLERMIAWGWKSTSPPVELFALQEIGQIGAGLDIVALFSAPPNGVPPLEILRPDGSRQTVYGAGAAAARYSFVPSLEGSYRAVIRSQGAPTSLTFQVSDIPFDIAHPEARPDTLRRIAARTGGVVLRDRPHQPLEASLGHALALPENVSPSFEEHRVTLSRTPLFFVILALLMCVLWTLESRWLR